MVGLAVAWSVYLAFAIDVSVTLDQAVTPGLTGGTIGGLTLVAGLVLAVVTLVRSYVFPVALCAVAVDRSLAAAFDRSLIDAPMSGEYAIGLLLALGTGLILGTFGLLTSVLLVAIPVLFYSMVAISRLIAIGYRESDASGDTTVVGSRVSSATGGHGV